MTFFDVLIIGTLGFMILYNLMLLQRVRGIFKTHPALFNYTALLLLAFLLLLLAVALLIALTMILF